MSLEPVAPDDPTARTRDLFLRASAGVDQGMAFRLQRARRDALAPRRSRPLLRQVPAAAMVVAALALGIAWWLPSGTPTVPSDPAAAESVEIERLLSGEEDPELYAWLADAPVATSARGTP